MVCFTHMCRAWVGGVGALQAGRGAVEETGALGMRNAQCIDFADSFLCIHASLRPPPAPLSPCAPVSCWLTSALPPLAAFAGSFLLICTCLRRRQSSLRIDVVLISMPRAQLRPSANGRLVYIVQLRQQERAAAEAESKRVEAMSSSAGMVSSLSGSARVHNGRLQSRLRFGFIGISVSISMSIHIYGSISIRAYGASLVRALRRGRVQLLSPEALISARRYCQGCGGRHSSGATACNQRCRPQLGDARVLVQTTPASSSSASVADAAAEWPDQPCKCCRSSGGRSGHCTTLETVRFAAYLRLAF